MHVCITGYACCNDRALCEDSFTSMFDRVPEIGIAYTHKLSRAPRQKQTAIGDVPILGRAHWQKRSAFSRSHPQSFARTVGPKRMITQLELSTVIWIGVALCIAQSAIFSGLNLAFFSLSRLRLEVEAINRNVGAMTILELRKDSNLLLATLLWGNVAVNVLLTLLCASVLTGLATFFFSTVVITLLCEIVPQAYFSRNALRVAAYFTPIVKIYQLALFPIAKPTALFLNWWLGHEGITVFRERDLRALITTHLDISGTEVSRLEGIGALNFLDLDDIVVAKEGEPVDPLSVIALPIDHGRPLLPDFTRTPRDPFMRQLDASGKKWVIITDLGGHPQFVLDAHHFLRDALFDEIKAAPEHYWHRPIVVTDMRTRLGDVIGQMTVMPEHAEDDVIDMDLILVWGDQRRIITGADLLGRLLRGIATKAAKPG
jgi:metal transporter CNNM